MENVNIVQCAHCPGNVNRECKQIIYDINHSYTFIFITTYLFVQDLAERYLEFHIVGLFSYTCVYLFCKAAYQYTDHISFCPPKLEKLGKKDFNT